MGEVRPLLPLPIVIPGIFAAMIGLDRDIGAWFLLGAVTAALAAIVGGGTWHRMEQKALRKQSARIRRQLQRMLDAVSGFPPRRLPEPADLSRTESGDPRLDPEDDSSWHTYHTRTGNRHVA